MDTNRIKVTGYAEVDGKLDDTKDYSVCYKRLGVRKVERVPLEDGNYQYTFVLENLDVITIIGEDKLLTGKTKKDSQKLRATCWNFKPEEDFYHQFISRIIHPDNFQRVVAMLELDEVND